MANPDRPNGFRPVGTLSGAPWQALIRRGVMGSGDGTAAADNIYIGDPVKFDAVVASGNSLVNTLIPAVSGAVDIVGVCVGVGYIPAGNSANEAGMFNAANLEKRYGDASLATTAAAAVYIYYVPVNDVIFEIQSNADLDLTIGEEVDFALGTGSTTTSQSAAELTSGGDDVQVVAIPEYADNDSTLANARYHVMFADRAFSAVAEAPA